MADYVRVKCKTTKHESSVVRSAYERTPEAYTLLEKKKATGPDGRPLPPKHHKSLSRSTATTGQTADSDKETP